MSEGRDRGGTGKGVTPVTAKNAKEMVFLILSVAATPFQVERARLEKAKGGGKRLSDVCDAVIFM